MKKLFLLPLLMACLGSMLLSCQTGPELIPVSGVTLNTTSLTMTEGDTQSITATVSPSNASNKQVLWMTSNMSVVSVNDGELTALAPGAAAITVKTDDNGYTATCTVVVKPRFISVSSVSLDESSLLLHVGEVQKLVATVMPANANNKAVMWKSSDASVVSVSGGVISAVSLGEAVITVTTEDELKEASCKVTVVPTQVTGVSLDRTSLSMLEGDQEQLTATVAPQDATNKNVRWSTSNSSVATVDASGRVTALKAGTATITVATEDGSKSATCDVTVTALVSSVSLNKTEMTLIEGSSEILTASILPANASNKNVRWTSSSTAVATVDASGKVTAVKAGTATITVITEDGSKTASCKVTVIAPVSGISLNKNDMTLAEGASAILAATISPSNATNKNVRWTSSDATVATVDAFGKVTAVKAGTATITVTTEDGGKTATCKVTVIAHVSSVSLNKTEMTLAEDSSDILTATILPANASNKNVRWTSSSTAVATVDASGRVTAVKAGTATITVITEDGSKTATCKVTVIAHVASISLNRTQMSIEVGRYETLTATILPSNATNKNVRWTSSNAAVASVDASGKVTAVKIGTATVTVTTQDGAKTATCAVTVIPRPVESVSLNKTEMSLIEGSSEILTATVLPAIASNKDVRWTSSNAAVASVDASGRVTAVSAGTATITVTTEDGGKMATCKVSVIALVSSVSLNKTAVTLEEGRYETLTATILPTNATNKNVEWTSSNSAVATVDASGKVTAVKVGSATVTVTTEDGAKTASCVVTVIPRPVESVSLNKTTLELKEGTSETLIATINPQQATNKNVTWSSSDVTVATVDTYGNVLAKDDGKAIITVTTVDGNKTAQCTVTVIGVNSIGEGGSIVTPNSKK